MNAKITWETRSDDGLAGADKAVDFLNSEFQPADADRIWFDGYFQWKLGKENPAGKGYLTLGFADGQVIATIALSRKRVLFNGSEYIAAEFGDAYCSHKFFANLGSYVPKELHPDYRSPAHYVNKSIFGRAAFETTFRALDDKIAILYGTPNQNALPSWIKRLGHFQFEQHDVHALSRPTYRYLTSHYRYFRPFAFALKKVDAVVSYTISAYFKVGSKARISVEKNTLSKEEVNQLWNSTKPSSGFALVRDFLYWNYRYFNYPVPRYTIWKVRSGGKTCGVVVTSVQKISAGMHRCCIVEWMIEPGYSLDGILASIILALRSEPIDHFVTYCNLQSNDAAGFKKNFFRTGDKINISFYKTETMNPESLNDGPFLLYMGNTDAI